MSLLVLAFEEVEQVKKGINCAYQELEDNINGHYALCRV